MRRRDWARRLLVVATIGLGLAVGGSALPPQPPPTMRAEVSRAFNGDEIRALLENGSVETIRYIGVDAPPPSPTACFGPESALYNRDLVLNRTVWLELDEQERDADGNLLAYVYLDPQGLTMVNAIMLSQGMARTQSRDAMAPNTRYADLFESLAQGARSSEIGIWGACPESGSGRDEGDDGNNGNDDDEGSSTGNRAPQAAFTFAPERPSVGETIRFDAAGSSDPDGRITQYDWDFGDGAGAQGETVTHQYSADGNYTVTLTVLDDGGSTGRSRRTVTVGSATQEPPDPDPEPDPTPTGTVIIERVHYDAEGEDIENKNGEWVELRAGNRAVDMTGWTLMDELGDRGVTSHTYRFPDEFVLRSGSRVKVFTGCGEDSTSELYWCARTQIWANGEDTVFLRNANGDLVNRCRYGDPDGSERGASEFNCETRQFNDESDG